MPKLKFKSSSGKTLEVEISSELDEITIGRNPGNIIRIANQSISRNHARIKFDGVRCTIYDLNSSNGVFVNGKRVRSQALYNGDRLRCGEFPLDFEDPSDAAQPPPLSELSNDTPLPDATQPGVDEAPLIDAEELERLRQDLDDARRSRDKAEQALDDYKENNPTLDEFQALVAERAELEQKLAQLGAEGAEGDNEALRSELEALREELETLREERDALQQQVESAPEPQEGAEGDDEALRGELEALREELETLRGEQESLREERDALQQQVEELQERHDEQAAENLRLSESTVSANESTEQQAEQLTSLQSELDAARDALEERALEDEAHQALQATHDALQAEHDALQAAHDAFQAEHDAFQTKHDAFQAEHDAFQAEHDALLDRHEALQAEQETLQAAHEALRAEHARLNEALAEQEGDSEAIAALQEERDTWRATSEAVEAERDQLLERVEGLEAELDTLRAERDQRVEELEQLQLSTRGITVDAFEALLAERDQLLEQQRAPWDADETQEVESLKAERDRYKEELEQIRADALDGGEVSAMEQERLRGSLEAAVAERDALRSELNQTRDRLETLQIEREQLRQEVDHARSATQADLAEHQEALREAYHGLTRGEQLRQEMARRGDTLEAERDQLQARLAASQEATPSDDAARRIDALEAERQELLDTIRSLEEQLAETRTPDPAEVDGSLLGVDLLREQLHATEEDLRNAEMEHDALLAKIRGLEQALKSRNVEMEQIVRERNDIQRGLESRYPERSSGYIEARRDPSIGSRGSLEHTAIEGLQPALIAAPSTQLQAHSVLANRLSRKLRVTPAELREHVEEEGSGLVISPAIYGQLAAALNCGKHVALIGPQSAGPRELARDLSDFAHGRGLSLGSLSTTVSTSWSADDTLGQTTDAFGFVPGVFLEAIRSGQWLVLHDLDHPEPAALFGPLTSVLSGYPVALPFLVGGERLSLLPPASDEPSAWLPEDAHDGTTWVIHPNWRMIVTLPSMKAARSMSADLRRRFVFIPLPGQAPVATYADHLPAWLEQTGLAQHDEVATLEDLIGQLLAPEGALASCGALSPPQLRELLIYIHARSDLDAELALGDALSEALTLFVLPEVDDADDGALTAIRAQLSATLPESDARELLLMQLPEA